MQDQLDEFALEVVQDLGLDALQTLRGERALEETADTGGTLPLGERRHRRSGAVGGNGPGGDETGVRALLGDDVAVDRNGGLDVARALFRRLQRPLRDGAVTLAAFDDLVVEVLLGQDSRANRLVVREPRAPCRVLL